MAPHANFHMDFIKGKYSSFAKYFAEGHFLGPKYLALAFIGLGRVLASILNDFIWENKSS